MIKVLITGVSGLLGSNLAYCWKDKFEILGLYRNHPWALKGIKTSQAELLNSRIVEKIVKEFNPDVIVHSAAMANVDDCEENEALAYEANVSTTKNLVDAAGPAKFIYISTDLAYDGKRGGYKETDPVKPVNVYAKTKLQGETIALQKTEALVCRTNFFGWNVQDKMCFAERVAKEATTKKVPGATDWIFSPIYTFDLADLLEQAIAKDLTGVYHFVADGSLSRYDFADKLAQKLGYGTGRIEKKKLSELNLKVPRAADLSLKTDKLSKALGPLPTTEATLDRFVADLKASVPDKIKSTARKAVSSGR